MSIQGCYYLLEGSAAGPWQPGAGSSGFTLPPPPAAAGVKACLHCGALPGELHGRACPTRGVALSPEPLRHSTKENGDCPHWCEACKAGAASRGVPTCAPDRPHITWAHEVGGCAEPEGNAGVKGLDRG